MWGVFKSIGGFFKRQAKTKTGKYGIGIIAGAILANNAPPGIVQYIPAVVEQVLSPEVAAGMAGVMFLRDKAAKKDERDGDE